MTQFMQQEKRCVMQKWCYYDILHEISGFLAKNAYFFHITNFLNCHSMIFCQFLDDCYIQMSLKWFFVHSEKNGFWVNIKFARDLRNVITHWLHLLWIAGDRVCVCKFFPWEIRASLGPVGSQWVLPPIWPGQISILYPGDDISKNHLSWPCSFRGDRCLSFPVFFCLVFY